MKNIFYKLTGIKILFVFLFAGLFCLNNTLKAQSIFGYDYGTQTGSVSSGTGTNPAFFSTPSPGTFFYGFSSSASATITAANPGLLRLGTFTEAQVSAGNGTSQFSKFGVMNYVSSSYKSSYNKFDVVLAGNTGSNYSDNGVWYFFSGDGGSSDKFMYNNTTTKNLLQTCTALRWTFTANGGLSFAYYSYLNSTTGQWLTIPGIYSQTLKYTIETISNKGSSFTYKRYGTTYTCAQYKMDIWVNGILVVQQGNIASTNSALGRVDSYCFYGEGSNTAYLYTDDAVYSYNINANECYAYYSKSTGDLSLTSTWGTNTDGSGTTPSNFTTNLCSYFIRNNATPTIGTNWTVSGFNSKVAVGDGTNACNFTIPSGYTYSGTLDVANNGTLTLQNSTIPTFGVLFDGSTVNYAISGSQDIAYPVFYNLKISGTGTKTLTASVTAHGIVTVGDGTNAGTLLIPSAYSLTGTTNVSNNATLSIQNSTNPTLGTLGAGSTVEYALASNGQSVVAANYVNLTFSNYNKTLPSSGTVGISGIFTTGIATGHTVTGSTVSFNGTSAQTVPAFTYNNLTINNSNGVTAGADFIVNGILNLQSANPSSTQGCITLGTDTLTMGASATTVGIGDVTGYVKRTSFTAYNSYTFGNQFSSLSFTSGGAYPSEIKVKINIGSAPGWKTGAIKRVYELVHTGGSSCYANIQIHYLDAEINGNTESDLVNWSGNPNNYDSVIERGKSNYNTTDNWVSFGLVNIADFPTSFGHMEISLANSEAGHYIWNGSTSADWMTGVNWTPTGIPGINSAIVIPDASTTTYDPLLVTTEIGTVNIESGGILNSQAGVVLTINGSSGSWINVGGTFNPGTSTVVFTNSNPTAAGTTNFYNVSINSGTTLWITEECTIRISGAITNNGVIRTISGNPTVVEYNGGDQTVIIPNPATNMYYTLKLSGSGTKTMPSTALYLMGDLIVTGTANVTLAASLTINGNLTIDNEATFNTGNYDHSVGGNIVNNGTFTTYTGKTITMNGTSAQTIGGTTSTTFANLTINNSTGVSLSGSTTTVNETLTLTSGTFNVSTNTLILNNAVSIGSGTIASSTTGTINYNKSSDGQTLTVGNYGNLTFSNYSKVFPSSGTIGIAGIFTPGLSSEHKVDSSTIDFNGSEAQTIPVFKYYNLNVSNSGANITLANSGTIYIAGTFTPGSSSFGTITGSTIEYNGTIAQTQNAFTFNNITLNNNTGLTLTGDCIVNGALNLTNGKLKTLSNVLYFGTSATLSAENDTNYVEGIAFMFPRNVGTGTINFLNCNVQGSVDLGDVSISRRTGQEGIITIGSYSSIASRWNITTSVTMSGTRDVSYTWPSVLDNGNLFSNVNKARLWCYNDTTFLWDTVGNGIDVSVANPRTLTINHSHFSLYVISSEGSPLPVVLSSFTSNVNVRDVKLNWITALEKNNSGFEIMRSSLSEKDNWIRVGYIKGTGTKNSPTNYSFEDKKLNTGKYKYRLKQIDNNGNFEYYNLSNTIEIGVPKNYALSQNYPNPFNPVTKIDFELPLDSRVRIIVYDMLGREVKVVMNSELKQAGYHTVEMNAVTLASGVYVYRMIANANGKDNIFTKKMVQIK